MYYYYDEDGVKKIGFDCSGDDVDKAIGKMHDEAKIHVFDDEVGVMVGDAERMKKSMAEEEKLVNGAMATENERIDEVSVVPLDVMIESLQTQNDLQQRQIDVLSERIGNIQEQIEGRCVPVDKACGTVDQVFKGSVTGSMDKLQHGDSQL